MHPNSFTQLESLVEDAEAQHNAQKTSEIQRYFDTHPDLPQYTRNLTHEIKEKLIYHLANGDRDQEAKIRGEVEALQAHLVITNEPGNILFSLLGEELILGFLMLRQCDISAARNYGQTSAQQIRRTESIHVRWMRTIRTLASIQKLPPFINVNLGQQIVQN